MDLTRKRSKALNRQAAQLVPWQAMTQQQRALLATTQGSFVTPTTGLGSYNVVHAYN